MSLWIVVLLFVVGLIAIIKGGDMFVDAATWMAEVSGIPKLIIGATVVSLATTLPELIVSVMATLDGKIDMAIGNAVGSVTANTGLIMAISLLFIPTVIKRRDYVFKAFFMLSATLILVACGFIGSIGVIGSALLLIIFVFAVVENINEAHLYMGEISKKNPDSEKRIIVSKEKKSNIVKFFIGAAAIVIGSRLLVDNGSNLATLLGVPERIIAVTLVALGTSLPELVTTLSAIIKKESSISVGNIIGANIIDLTFILPVCSILSGKTIPVSGTLALLDLPAALLVGSIALLPTLFMKKFARWQGVLLLIAYFSYIIVTITI